MFSECKLTLQLKRMINNSNEFEMKKLRKVGESQWEYNESKGRLQDYYNLLSEKHDL